MVGIVRVDRRVERARVDDQRVDSPSSRRRISSARRATPSPLPRPAPAERKRRGAAGYAAVAAAIALRMIEAWERPGVGRHATEGARLMLSQVHRRLTMDVWYQRSRVGFPPMTTRRTHGRQRGSPSARHSLGRDRLSTSRRRLPGQAETVSAPVRPRRMRRRKRRAPRAEARETSPCAAQPQSREP